VPVHLIAELVAQGGKPTELIESYPHLTAEMIRLAPPPMRCAARDASSRGGISSRVRRGRQRSTLSWRPEVNHVLEVDLDGEQVTLTLYDLPSV
jgi:hypothetical protein